LIVRASTPNLVRLYFPLLGLCFGLLYLRFMPADPLVRLGIVATVTLVFSALTEVHHRRSKQPARIPPTGWICLALIGLGPLDNAAIWLGVPENWAVGAMAAMLIVLVAAMVLTFRRTRQQIVGPLSSAKLRLMALCAVMLIVGVTIGVALSLSD